MQNSIISQQSESPTLKAVRQHYLDALRVLAVLMVFLYHSAMPFTLGQAVIVNEQTSLAATIFFVAFLAPWGMPFFFLLASASTWFALQRRTARQFAGERFRRLLVPFVAGSLLFTPPAERAGVALQHAGRNVRRHAAGLLPGTVQWLEPYGLRVARPPPLVPGLPLRRLTAPAAAVRMAETGEGAAVRVAVGRVVRAPGRAPHLPAPPARGAAWPVALFPEHLGWGDFAYYLVFFLAGYLFYADDRFPRAVQRDW